MQRRLRPGVVCLLLGCLLQGLLGPRLMAADAAVEAPPVIVDSLRLPGGGERLLVHLPEDRAMAVRLLHEWNAAAALLDRPPGAFPSWRVPTLAELIGVLSRDGHPPSAVRGVAGWRLPDLGTRYRDYPPTSVRRAGFDLRRFVGDAGPMSGSLVLAVPHELHRQRIQAFVDAQSQAYGLQPPRPDIPASAPSLSKASKAIAESSGFAQLTWGNYIMLAVALLLLYLGIGRGFEPLLLVPIAVGCILVNAIGAGMVRPPGPDEAGGMLWFFVEYGISTGIFPLLIFLGVGALTDFGPLLANPWSALLGAAAQFGIFGSFFLAILAGEHLGLGFTLEQAGAIAIIGGADGPTSIYVASKLAPELLGAIAVAAYSYMALVPILQPPIMRLFTNRAERAIMMQQARPVSRRARILFPIAVILLCVLLLPSAVPLIGMLMFGNLLRESAVTGRLAKAAQNELINLVTIGLGLAVGTKLSAEAFLNAQTMGILVLGCLAFMIGTAAGVLFGKVMRVLSGGRINPLIGAAGVSAVPMAARVVQVEGARYNRRNTLLMHAMGPNVAGVIGSAVAAGILLALLG